MSYFCNLTLVMQLPLILNTGAKHKRSYRKSLSVDVIFSNRLEMWQVTFDISALQILRPISEISQCSVKKRDCFQRNKTMSSVLSMVEDTLRNLTLIHSYKQIGEINGCVQNHKLLYSLPLILLTCYPTVSQFILMHEQIVSTLLQGATFILFIWTFFYSIFFCFLHVQCGCLSLGEFSRHLVATNRIAAKRSLLETAINIYQIKNKWVCPKL